MRHKPEEKAGMTTQTIHIATDARICWHCQHWDRHGKSGDGWCRTRTTQVATWDWWCVRFLRKQEGVK